MNIKVKLDIDVKKVTESFERANKSANSIVVNEFLKMANYYARQDSGALIDSSLIASDFENGSAIWDVTYASEVYYTGTPSKDRNPNARLQWARVAADENLEELRRIRKEAIARERNRLK